MRFTTVRPDALLQIWEAREEEWIRYRDIVEEIRKWFPGLAKAHERTMIRYLNKLVKEERIEKKITLDHRTWYRPKNAKDVAQTVVNHVLETYPNDYFKTVLETFHEVAPGLTAPVEAFIFLDEGHGEKMRTILQEANTGLRLLATGFVEEFKKAMINVYGVKYKWCGWKTGPLKMRELVKQEKTGLDFNAVLLLHFKGREIVNKIDWDDHFRKLEEADKIGEESWGRFCRVTGSPGPERRALIEIEVIDKLLYAQNEFMKFLAKVCSSELDIDDIVQRNWKGLGMPSELVEFLVNGLATPPEVHALICEVLSEVRGNITRRVPPTLQEVKEALEKLIREGVVEIGPRFFRVDEAKAAKTRHYNVAVIHRATGYVLP
jgi:hypothetical protein